MVNAAPTAGKLVVDSTFGIDFTSTSTTALFKVGTQVRGSDNSEWVYCKYSTAAEQYSAVSINTTFDAVVPLTLALLRTIVDYGWTQVAQAAASYGWVCIKGKGIGVLARLSSLAAVPCYISSVSAGRITTTSVRSTSGGTMLNVVLTTSVTTAGATVANASWPGTSRVGG